MTQLLSRRIAAALIFFVLSLVADAKAEQVIPRRIRVGIAVAPNFKTLPDWKSEFERRLSYASRIFKTEFRLEFFPAIYWDWKPADPDGSMDSMMEDLKSRFPIGKTDIVVGLTRLEEIPSAGQIPDLHVLGRARPFSGYMVMRYPFKRLHSVQAETILVHELAHLFGAVHAGQDTIMAPVVGRHIPTRFDPQNRVIIKLTRGMDFTKGTEVLDSRMQRELLGSYMELIDTKQSYDFYYTLGIFYLNLGQNFEALKAWKAARDLDRDNPQIHFDLGAVYFKSGRYDEAIRELGQAVAGMRFPSQRPNKVTALRMLGSSYFQKRNYEAAQSVWMRALADLNRMKDADPVQKAEVHKSLGQVYSQQRRWDEAIRELTAALQLQRNDADVYGMMGVAWAQKGELERAVSVFNDGLKRISSRKIKALFHKNIGYVFIDSKKWDRAEKEFRSSVSEDWTVAESHFGLALVCLQKKDTLTAKSSLRTLLQLNPDHKEAREILSRLG